jgi:hypothetical protein
MFTKHFDRVGCSGTRVDSQASATALLFQDLFYSKKGGFSMPLVAERVLELFGG